MKLTLLALFVSAVPVQAAFPVNRLFELHQTFYQVVNDPAPDVALQTKLIDALLTSLYRSEALINDFERELGVMKMRSEMDSDFTAEPLTSPSYQDLQTMGRVAKDLQDKVVFIYRRLLEVGANPASTAELKQKAEDLLRKTDQYFANLPVEDRLQLGDLLKEIRELRGGSIPDLEITDYGQFKKEVAQAKTATRAKAERAQNTISPELDREAESDAVQTYESHGPNTPLYPSTGRDGVVTGDEFADGHWVLTFDDGPSPEYSIPLMEALLSHRDKLNPTGAPGSFFWLAENVVRFPSVVQYGADSGFSLNCHSWKHLDLRYYSHKVREHEVIDAVKVERQAFGRNFRFYRCPYGSCIRIPEVRQMIADLGLLHASWSVDSLDWKLKDAARTFELLKAQLSVQKHGIILMHDIHPASIEAVKMLLDWIGEQNDSGEGHYELYTIDDAVDLYNARVSVSR